MTSRSWSAVLRRASGFAALITLLAVRGASAQLVRGQVRDSVSGQPLPGVLVRLIGPHDTIARQTLTDASGRFNLDAGDIALFEIRFMRIGYRPTTLPAMAPEPLEIALAHLSRQLTPVRTVADPNCRTRDDAARAAALWEQAQTALAAAVVWRDRSPARMRIIRYERTLPRIGPRVSQRTFEYIPRIIDQTVRVVDGIATRPFAPSGTAAMFADSGFASRASGARVIVPDEDVLLSDEFARTHCFRIDEDNHDASRVGIQFEPARTRDAITEIRGTLWIDSARSAIDSVEFTYVHLPPDMEASDTAVGGSLTFATMPNGIPLLVRWRLVLPERGRLGYLRWRRGSTRLYDVVALQQENGGVLARAEWPDGTAWSTPLAVQRGRIVDGSTGEPRTGVALQLVNAGETSVSDSAGRFEFADLIDGPYLFVVADTLYTLFHDVVHGPDSHITGYSAPKRATDDSGGERADEPLMRRILVQRDSATLIQVQLPRIEPAFRARCGISFSDDSSGVIAAWVLRGSEPVKHARVIARWTDRGGVMTRAASTDDRGRAIICGVPRRQPVLFGPDGENSTMQQVVIGSSRSVSLVVVKG